MKQAITLSTLIGKKVRVYISSILTGKLQNFYVCTYFHQQNLITNHLCLLNPTFHYVKKYKRLECRGVLIPFSYDNYDIRKLCHDYSPVTLEVIGGQVMYSTGYSLMKAKSGKLALLNGGHVHVYGPQAE